MYSQFMMHGQKNIKLRLYGVRRVCIYTHVLHSIETGVAKENYWSSSECYVPRESFRVPFGHALHRFYIPATECL